MYIYKIVIENFRNFEKFKWKPNPTTNVLFGHNGCGKTNLATAISFVFNTSSFESYFEPSDYYLGDMTRKIRIQIWVSGWEELEISCSLSLQHIDDNDDLITDDSTENSKAVLIYQLESDDEHKKKWSFFQQTTQLQDCPTSARKAVQFLHVDADRQPLKEIGLQKKSTFYQDAYDDIGEEIDRISKELINTANAKISQSEKINSYLETIKALGDVAQIDSYSLLLKNPASTWSYSGYELGTSLSDVQLSFNKHSKGIRSLFLLLLMKKHLAGSGIVFIEELEQNLEPKHQRYIADEYKSLNVGQLFITSHSPDVISHFDYDSISIIKSDVAIPLMDTIPKEMKKEVFSMNKKEFISALMAKSVLLIEGESEHEAFPFYSYKNKLSLSTLDIELFKVGGKGKADNYASVFKEFGLSVYALVDNDKDITSTLNKLRNNADKVFVMMDSYEDMIWPYYKDFQCCLNELVEFGIVKNKLVAISKYDCLVKEKVDKKKETLCNYIADEKIIIEGLTSYECISKFPVLAKYVLHDSFAKPYFARSIAAAMIEKNIVPIFFVKLINALNNNGTLAEKNGYENVFELNEDN